MVELIETTQDAIASYPYDDLEEGFGLVSYYLSKYTDSTGDTYSMGKELNYSSTITIGRNIPVGGGTDTFTFYSGSFSRPRVVKGEVRINFDLSADSVNATNTIIQIKIYHYDGSTSTQIGSTWTSETYSGEGQPGVIPINAIIDTGTKKFRAGDQIKMELIIDADSYFEYLIGIDPQNRDSGNLDFTQFIVRVPFNLVN